jgi:predicted permease
MDLIITTFESVAILLGIGLLGYWIIRRRIIPVDNLGLLSPLALDIALPSLILIRILNDFSPTDYPEWWHLPLWWCFFTVVVGGLTFIFSFVSVKKTRREFAITLFYQNAIFFPLAILTGIFPNDSSYQLNLFLFTIFYAAFFFSTYRFFFKSKDKLKIDLKKIIHPVLIFTIIGVFITYLGIQDNVPYIIVSILTLLGGMTIPLIMIILGGNIYLDFKKIGKINYFEMIKFVIIKNFIFPLTFIVILTNLADIITHQIALIILIQSAVPPVTAVPLVTERAGGDRSIVNQYIIGSFITSLVSIPLMVYLFETFIK